MKATYICGNKFPTTWDDYVAINADLPNITICSDELKEELIFAEDGWVDIDIKEPLLTQEKTKELLLMIYQDVNPDITEIEFQYNACVSV